MSMRHIAKVNTRTQYGFCWNYCQDEESLLDELGVEEVFSESDFE